MVNVDFALQPGLTHSNWVRLRTLILLRWMAIAGQFAAIVGATFFFDLQLPLIPCLLTVGASITANILATFLFPGSKRLTEREALLTLLFDLSQLSFLIFLTGGLANPFALLILVPVTISASTLEPRATVFLGLTAILLISATTLFHVPLRFADGVVFVVPRIFEFGFWLSIVIGILFLGLYSWRVASEMRSMSAALLATQMALVRGQRLTDIGGVIAATAHELGTPLATIKLVSVELMRELTGQTDLLADAALIRDQAERCRHILRDMGRVGKVGLQLRHSPLGAVLNEAAEPHLSRGKAVNFSIAPAEGVSDRQPAILRKPEVIHGLRNLIQNAVDFARSRVWIDAEWSEKTVTVQVVDDGDGYPRSVIGRIGDPFVRKRRSERHFRNRPEYEGMGLGLFIAKTLLERTGAKLTFANATDPFLMPDERPERCGAAVTVTWALTDLVGPDDAMPGENQP